MLSFENDYSEGCHPRILEALTRTNLEQLPGYGAEPLLRRSLRKDQGGLPGPAGPGVFHHRRHPDQSAGR